jgi:hypothetical protein
MKIEIEWNDATETKVTLGENEAAKVDPGTQCILILRDEQVTGRIDLTAARLWRIRP